MSLPLQNAAPSNWREIVGRYQRSDLRRSITQLLTTMIPLAAAFYLMYLSLSLPYWVTLLISIPTGGLLVRTFIIMHDCAHGSFLPSRRGNEILGYITGVMTLTPFGQWRHSHSLHHASSGDLHRRGDGDVETLTIREYLALPKAARVRYRIKRNPFVLFGIGPLHFIVMNRIPSYAEGVTPRQRKSVWTTNLGVAVMLFASSLVVGWKATILIYLPAIYVAAIAGIWLFYVQHQFEDTYWKEHGEWDYATAAIRGSSYLQLPPVLRWFTGSIGLHHVHHLGPRIPNYALKQCHDENPLFHQVTTLTLRDSVRTLRLTLWDEDRQRLVGYREALRQKSA